VKCFFFHLMPYAPLDPAAREQYDSAWVTLPNSYYDPREGHRLYNRYLDELELADALGFDGVGVNEHHQTAYGLMPAPNLFAAALARRTHRAKIAVLGRALPILANPLAIAEEYAILDNLTAGRLICGFVRGIGAEYHTTGVNPARSHERFHEAHDLIVQAWTRTGPFPFEGHHYHFQYVNVWPRPYQQPHPPVWIPSQGSTETMRWASAPERRYPVLQTFSPRAAVKKYLGLYKQCAQEWGYEASPGQLGWAVPIYVAKTDEEAKAQAREHIEAFFNRFVIMPPEMLLPPGYLSLPSLKGVMAAKRGITGQKQTIENLLAQGMLIAGSPETVYQQLADAASDIGFALLVGLFQFGTLPHELTVQNLTLFAREVMPRLRALARSAPR
jgi:alkanesulfonate monooxygenase SsuD/methylene tetrahydromethanopterin reductase-like flavin-dependent oxidoreductase (luciferase family)